MGIQGLRKLLKEHVNNITLDNYKGKSLAIDTSTYMYQYRYNSERKGKGCHLRGFYEMIVTLLEKSIIPIFVLDGKPPDEKGAELDKRKETIANRNSQIDKIKSQMDAIINSNSLSDLNENQAKQFISFQKELAKLQKNQIIMKGDFFGEVIDLFKLAGVPYIISPSESDFVCVNLCQKGIVAGIISEDMDMLTHGACNLLTGINDMPFRKKGELKEYNLEKCLNGLNLNKRQFIDLCILCKCDYTCKIEGIAGKTALKLIGNHNNIETIISKIEDGTYKRYKIPDDFNYLSARTLFNKAEKQIFEQLYEKPNHEKVKKYLLENTNYTTSTLNKKLMICKSFNLKPKLIEKSDQLMPKPKQKSVVSLLKLIVKPKLMTKPNQLPIVNSIRKKKKITIIKKKLL